MKISWCFIVFLLGINGLFGQEQESFVESETTLVQLSRQFLKDSLANKRVAAEADFTKQLTEVLQQKNSFSYPFSNLETVSVLYPSDSTFRIFTWQLYIDKNTYQYGGIIQKQDASNSLFVLSDLSSEIATYDMEHEVMEPENWYGAIYFNLQEFPTAEGTKYLLFGFDGLEFFNRRKIAEVLSFDEAGQPSFGAPVFAEVVPGYEPTFKNRLYLEYSAEVAARLNYDPNLEMIILDNLISMKSPYRGGGNVNIPDGSYVGYRLNNGTWEYVDKVFDLVSERPPAPRRLFDEDNRKDILGNKARGKKRDKNLPMKN